VLAGAARHYTLSYSLFYQKLHSDANFSQWFQAVRGCCSAGAGRQQRRQQQQQ
jgi:hypothetical protein